MGKHFQSGFFFAKWVSLNYYSYLHEVLFSSGKCSTFNTSCHVSSLLRGLVEEESTKDDLKHFVYKLAQQAEPYSKFVEINFPKIRMISANS